MQERRPENLLLDRPLARSQPALTSQPQSVISALQRSAGNHAVAALLSPAAQLAGGPLASGTVLALQRSAGNEAVATRLARKPSPQSSTEKGSVPSMVSPAGADGRGIEQDDEAGTDDRTAGAIIGGGIGAVVGAIGGGLVGGPAGAIIGGIGGAAVGAGIGALADGGSAPPVPVAVRNGPAHTPIDTADQAGMSIAITLTSSSGVDADMAAVQDSEQVSPSLRHTGSYVAVAPAVSNNSGYMAGFPIPNDRHGEPKPRIIDCADNHGGNGTMDREQLDTFTAASAGVTTPTAIPNSGYLIRRTITVAGTQIKFRLDKSPASVTVNGFTSAAGPSPAQADEVTVRP